MVSLLSLLVFFSPPFFHYRPQKKKRKHGRVSGDFHLLLSEAGNPKLSFPKNVYDSGLVTFVRVALMNKAMEYGCRASP